MTPENDRQLLALVAAGDNVAFGTIYNKYWEALFDNAYKRLKNPAQCEDIIQDIFINLWNRRQELEVDDLPAYLHTAVRYRIYNYIQRDLVRAAFYEPFEAIADHTADTGVYDPDQDLFILLETYIASLPNKQRQVFVLYFKEHRTVKQIAEQMGISPKTVQNHLSISLSGLRSHLVPSIILYCLFC